MKLRPLIEKVAKDQKLDLVLNLDGPTIVWVNPLLDITSDVVKQLAQAQNK